MADTTLLDNTWYKVESFSSFPDAPHAYFWRKDKQGTPCQPTIVNLNDLQEVLDTAIANGWKRS